MSLPPDESSKRHSRNVLHVVARSSIVTWLRQRNPIVVSLVLPLVLVFLLAAFWGQAGGILGWLLSLFLAPLLFIALSSKTDGKWKRYGIASAISGTSFFTAMAVASVTQVTVHRLVSSVAESAFLSYYSPTVGAKSRRFANKVIASVTLSSNVDELQKEIDFLLSSGQSKWLSADQLNKLRLKRETVIAIRGQKEADGRLYSQVLEALNSPISLQSYKSIVSTATKAPRSPRFEVVIPESLRKRLQQKLSDARSKGEVLELSKKKADEEKARQADYDAYLEAVTQVRKNVTRSVVQEMDSRGITYDSENDPVRLQIVQQIESEMKPKIYDSAPKTLTPAQLDSIWQEIQSQIKANL
jgi:hypothetical protein